MGATSSSRLAWKWKLSFLLIPLVGILSFMVTTRNRGLIPNLFNSTSTSDKPPKTFKWKDLKEHYPVLSYKLVPTPTPSLIPRIQHIFPPETDSEREIRLDRLAAVKGSLSHAWNGYRTHAWMKDEVQPLSGGAINPFAGWAATLVDALDTLWIAGMKTEFEEAVSALHLIDFTTCALSEINVFETTIRYLGGFLSAHDLTEGQYPILLEKAIELGDMLYKSFDTPNRMPVIRWDFHFALQGKPQEPSTSVFVSEPGSLTLEFTRLSQISGEPKYFDAVQRVMEHFASQQDSSKLPGMWPMIIDEKNLNLNSYYHFTIAGMADSLYGYLPKQYLLLGGGTQMYRRMYEYALIAMKRNIFFRPMTVDERDILLPGDIDTSGDTHGEGEGEGGSEPLIGCNI